MMDLVADGHLMISMFVMDGEGLLYVELACIGFSFFCWEFVNARKYLTLKHIVLN